MKHLHQPLSHLLLIKSMFWIEFLPGGGGHAEPECGVDDVHVVAVGPVCGTWPRGRPGVLVVVPHPGGDLNRERLKTSPATVQSQKNTRESKEESRMPIIGVRSSISTNANSILLPIRPQCL